MQRKNSILITSAGKRVELVQEFKKELNVLYPDAKVYTTDMNPTMAPAGHVSDGCFAVPRVTAEDYLDKLLAICEENGVRLVVPTIDTELLILARAKQRFAEKGIILSVSEEEFIRTCRDKRLTSALFESHSVKVPAPRDKHHPVFPMFAKPYDGSLSCNLHVLLKPEDLTADILNDEKLIFMELIDKKVFKEYTVDMYYGADHQVKGIVPRERIEIRAGEINKGRACKSWLVDYLKERMQVMRGVIGTICVQLFVNDDTHEVYAIEVNPRFGGGYPLSYYAGANFPKYLIQEYIGGESVDYSDDWVDNTIMLRYDSQVIIHG
jgi:carbamoyl-phosphate synthase large subunit